MGIGLSKKNRNPFVDTLRLTDPQRAEVDGVLRGSRSELGDCGSRDDTRFSYRAKDRVPVWVTHPGGTQGGFIVQPRDLGPSILGFIHAGYLYEDSSCHVVLTDKIGQQVVVSGRISCCVWLVGRAHWIDMTFDEPIQIDRFDVQPLPPLAKPVPDRELVQPREAELTTLLELDEQLAAAVADGLPLRRVHSHKAMSDCVDQMRAQVRDVVQALRRQRVPLALQKCSQVRKTATRCGYSSIAKTADRLTERIAQGQGKISDRSALSAMIRQIREAEQGLADAA